jgi:hypothetical protein
MLHMLNVTSIYLKCFICFRRIFASVLISILHMFHTYDVPNVSVLYCSKCFHVASCKCLSESYICCNGYTRMLQAYVLNVSTIFQKCVTSVLSRCCIHCSGYTHRLQAYVPNVSFVSDVCCSKCFMLQVFSLADTESERR